MTVEIKPQNVAQSIYVIVAKAASQMKNCTYLRESRRTYEYRDVGTVKIKKEIEAFKVN